MPFPSKLRELTNRCASMPVRSKPRTAQRQRREARRLLLEPLEGRRLMAFSVMAEYSSGNSFPYDLLLTQVNADNQPDMVLVNSNNSISVRLGNADGTFGDLLDSSTANSGSVAAGDFNGDDATDLVMTSSGGLSLLLGNGDGSFAPPQAIAIPGQSIAALPELGLVPQFVSSVAVGDLNGDGHLDLAAAGDTSYWSCGPYYCDGPFGDGYVNVLLGDGNGGFGASEVHHLGELRWPADIAIEDFNNDGQPDVMTANGSDLSVLLGAGSGALASPIHSGSGSSISLGDIDGDGFLDTITYGGPSIIVQKGQGNGSFGPSTPIDMSNGNYYNVDSAVVGDVNGDGKLDLVAVGLTSPCSALGYYGFCYDDSTTRQAAVVLGNGLGGFSAPILSSLGPADSYYQLFGAALADLTGDGLPELAVIDSKTATVVVAQGNWPPAGAPFLHISDTSVLEGDAGAQQVTITASLSTPFSQPVTANYHMVDVTAQAGSDYVAQSGQLTFQPGDTSQSFTVQVYGDRLAEADESFSIVLSNVVNAFAGSPGTIMVLDNEPRLSISDVAVTEGDTGTAPAVFTVSLSTAYDQIVTVDYVATGGVDDIVPISGTLQFTPGETSKTITVEVVGDTVHEELDAFTVEIVNPSPNASIDDGWGIGTIIDNDPLPPSIAITDASIVEGNSGTRLMTFTVSLSAASSGGVWVNYATANGTATTRNHDYTASSGSLYFAPGETSKTISVSVKGDTKNEKDERFYVNLSNAIGGEITDAQGVGTILNDDGGTVRNKKLSSAQSVDAAIDDLMDTRKTKRSR